MNTSSRSAGFTLMEALIALVILATGLLAIARFQSGLVTTSASSKARAEAIALAQQKIDQIRAYKDEPDLVANLNAATYDATKTFEVDIVNDSQVPDTAESLSGINADFERYWAIKRTPTTAELNVTVSWQDANSGTDASGNLFTESVMLSTDVVYQDPSLAGEQSLDEPQPIIPNTTGRSRLGEGHYDDLGALDQDRLTSNDDGTSTYENIDTGEVELIDTTTGDVLLTLEEACNVTDGGLQVCTDFVKVNGLIWVHDSSLAGNPDLSTIYVLASDNAVCTTKPAEAIDTGDYRYFPYRCYLGGGWSGNLGIIQAGANNTIGDVCMGDPASDTNEEIIAARRVYRGMLSRDLYTCPDNTAQPCTLGRDLYTDDVVRDGIEEFDAIGVADALVLPNPANTNINQYYNNNRYDPFGNLYLPGHNFMITNLGATPEDSDCVAPMSNDEVVVQLYQDANASTPVVDGFGNNVAVDAFLNTRDEFVCLNQVYTYDTTDVDGNSITALEIYFDPIDDRIEDGYLEVDKDQVKYETTTVDASGNSVYTIAQIEPADASANPVQPSSTNIINVDSAHLLIINECPYNPTANITDREFVFGSIYFSDSSASPVDGFIVNTSDDAESGTAGACDVFLRDAVGSGSRGSDLGTESPPVDPKVFADYVCKVYHDGSGWNGTISVTPANLHGCSSPLSYALSDITADTGNLSGPPGTLDFLCAFIPQEGADFAITHTVSDTSPSINDGPITFTTTITNNGLNDGTNISLTNIVPTGLTYNGTSATSISAGTPGANTTAGAWDSATGVWSGINLLDGDQATLTWQATINTVVAPVGSQITSNVTSFTADQPDSNQTADDITETIIVTDDSTANIQYVLELTSSNVNPGEGETISYKVTVTNLGGADATGVVVDTTPPPLGADFDSWAWLPADASYNAGGNGRWIIGALAAEDSVSLDITAVLSNTASGTISATLDRNPLLGLLPADPSTVGDVTQVNVSVFSNRTADLITTISADNISPQDGDTVTFTITVQNASYSPDTATDISVDVSDLATIGGVSGFDYSSSSNTLGVFNTFTGLWTGTNFDLAPGASTTLTVVTTYDAAAAGPLATITTGYATATGSPGTTDTNPTGDGDIDVAIVQGSSNTISIAGHFKYNSLTSTDVTGIQIGPVSADGTPGTLSSSGCTFDPGDATVGNNGDYLCTITIDPADNNGLYMVFAYSAGVVCSYNARIGNNGKMNTGGADELYWLSSTTLGTIAKGSVDIELAENAASCP